MTPILEKIQAKGTKITALRDDAQRLLDKDVPTQEDVLNAQKYTAEAKTLIGEVNDLKATVSDLHGLNKFITEAKYDLPIETPGVLGMKAAGETSIYNEGKNRITESSGDGVLTKAQIRAINDPKYDVAFTKYLRGANSRGDGFKNMDSIEYKTLQEGADGSGGFLLPSGFIARLIQKKATPTRIADACYQIQASTDVVVMPKVNYTTDDLYVTGVRATFTGEVPASSTTSRVTDPAFGQIRIPVYTAMLSMPLTNNMIEDAAFPIDSWVEEQFMQTIQLLRDNQVINGTGVGSPLGILNNPGGTGQPALVNIGDNAGAYDNTASGNGKKLINLGNQVPEQYDDNLAWVMNKTSVAAAIAQLTDSQARPLWSTGFNDSGYMQGFGVSNGDNGANTKRRMLLGYPVMLSGFMPNTGSNNNIVIHGDLTGYYVANRIGFSVQVLRELYAETNQVLLLGRYRFGGQTAEEWKIKVGKQA